MAFRIQPFSESNHRILALWYYLRLHTLLSVSEVEVLLYEVRLCRVMCFYEDIHMLLHTGWLVG
jgi:hypothetical protein